MNPLRPSARAGVGGRLRRSATRSLTAVAALAVSLQAFAAVTTAPAAAASGDEVIAWVEVEDGAISGGAAGPPAFNSGDHGNFSGTGSYTFRETGMTSTMTVDAPEAGTYPIYVRYAAGPLSASENVTRSMGLLTNGDRQQLSYPMTSFDDWEAWDFVSGEVTLDAGTNTLAIQCDRSVDTCRLNFDAIQVGGTAPDPCSATTPPDGYTSLFDGTFASFDGWRKAGAGGFGRQTDCTIRTFRGRGATWLTQQQTTPYTLKVDWMRPASNDDSGVYLASSSRGGADPVGGFKIPIGADTGAIVPTGGTAKSADQAALAGALRPVGEWNTYTIQLTGSRVAVSLNGTLVNTFDNPGALPASGFIGLENRSTTDTVHFSGIAIKPGVAPDTESSTSMTLAPESVPAGSGTASVSVEVDTAEGTPSGDVEIYVDGTKEATATLVDGAATTTVGPFDTTGSKSVEARYVGAGTTKPSTSPAATLVVEKATPTVRAKVRPRKVIAGKTKPKLVVTVSTKGFDPTGKVKVKVGAKRYAGRLDDGKATLRLPRFAKPGKVRAVVSYAGDARTDRGKATVRIRVRKG